MGWIFLSNVFRNASMGNIRRALREGKAWSTHLKLGRAIQWNVGGWAFQDKSFKIVTKTGWAHKLILNWSKANFDCIRQKLATVDWSRCFVGKRISGMCDKSSGLACPCSWRARQFGVRNPGWWGKLRLCSCKRRMHSPDIDSWDWVYPWKSFGARIWVN